MDPSVRGDSSHTCIWEVRRGVTCPERLSCLMMVGTGPPPVPSPVPHSLHPLVPQEADVKGLHAEHLISVSAAGKKKASRF